MATKPRRSTQRADLRVSAAPQSKKSATTADNELCYLSAVEALSLFRRKKLSPVELMDAVIARAETTNPILNAFSFTFFDEARELAKKAETKYMKGSAKIGALEGLPIGIKDENYLKGKPTSYGTIGCDIIAEKNSPNNERILAAGGIPHAKTCTPEWSITPYTNSRRWGITRNPWNTDFTPGGSTGGGSASLAAGSSMLVMGSDIGGSIRIPASTCGLVGFKPPHGRNPDDAPFNGDPYCHTGPLGRCVADVILLQNVVSGQHPRDMTTLPKLELPTKYRPIKGWRIAYSFDLGHYEVDKEVVANTKKALAVFRSLGATVEEIKLPWSKASYEATAEHLNMIFGTQVAMQLPAHRKDLTPYGLDFGLRGKKADPVKYVLAMDEECRMYETFSERMANFDLFICPTTALPAVRADHDHSRDQVLINGKDPGLNPPMLNWVMTSPFNTLNRLPVLAMPSGRASNNVPTGIQIIGKAFQDIDVFQAGVAYEKAFGNWFEDPKSRPRI